MTTKKIEEDLKTKFTHKFKLNIDDFKVNHDNFDLQYHDACFEFKINASQFDTAFAEILLNSGKKKRFFSRYVIVYTENKDDFVCCAFDYSDDFFPTHIKFEQETPSQPSEEALRFYNSLQKTIYIQKYSDVEDLFGKNEIKNLILEIENEQKKIVVTKENVIRVFNEWKSIIEFQNIAISNVSDDTMVQLFLCDLLNGTIYNSGSALFETETTTNFSFSDGEYRGGTTIFTLTDNANKVRKSFWEKYILPPTREVYNYIAEHRSVLFTEKYRRELGAQYTPLKLVELQWQMLAKQNITPESDVLWLDFACGTCNLLVDVGNKNNCFVSTYEAGDVNICRANGFNNVVQFDFLANNKMPEFTYQGETKNIIEIIKTINKPVVVVMNPPYENNKVFLFIDKIQKNIKNFTCFWYCRENDIRKLSKKNGWFIHKFQILDSALVNAKIFGLKNFGIVMSILKYGGKTTPVLSDFKLQVWEPKQNPITNRWELLDVRKGQPLIYRETKTYLDYAKKEIKAKNTSGQELNKMIYNTRFILDDEATSFSITETNLEVALIAAGTLWNNHIKFYDEDIYCPLDNEGNVKEFDDQMKADSILLAMCYRSNKAKEGFSLFSEAELGLSPHTLKAMKNGQMFHKWFAPYKANLSEEGKELYSKMLNVYKFYFQFFGINANKNVGLSELKLALMQVKVNTAFQKVKNKNMSRKGNKVGARVGKNSVWNYKSADRKYQTNLFSDYDAALVKLMTKQYHRFIAYGMIDAMPSCVR